MLDFLYNAMWAGIAQSIYQVTGIEFFTCPDWPWGPPSLLYDVYRVSFLQVKWLGFDFNHPLPSSTEVKERV